MVVRNMRHSLGFSFDWVEGKSSKRHAPRSAASAATAKAVTASKNCCDWPSNRPDCAKPVAAATAPARAVSQGRMTEHSARPLFRNRAGSGKIASETSRSLRRSGYSMPLEVRSPNMPSSDL